MLLAMKIGNVIGVFRSFYGHCLLNSCLLLAKFSTVHSFSPLVLTESVRKSFLRLCCELAPSDFVAYKIKWQNQLLVKMTFAMIEVLNTPRNTLQFI